MEDFDDVFFKSRFADGSGNYYHCDKAFLFNWGTDEEEYKNSYVSAFDGRQHIFLYDQQEGNGSYADLVRLVQVLSTASNQDFGTEISKVLDVDKYLRTLVVEICAGNPDSYSGRGSNWGIYHDPISDKFVFTPFDYDETYGINTDYYATLNVYQWPSVSVVSPWPPMTYRILDVPEFREKFTVYFWQFVTEIYNPETPLFGRLESFRDLLAYEVVKDKVYTLDFERNYHVFLQQTEDLQNFITTRYNAAISQLDVVNITLTSTTTGTVNTTTADYTSTSDFVTSGTTSSSSTGGNNEDKSSARKTNTSAVVASAVIGSLVLVGSVVALVILFIRRKYKTHQYEKAVQSENMEQPLENIKLDE